MVSHEAAVNSRKRKKTTDMEDSPPKRVTRARAKVTEDSGLEVKTTKITTASARIAAASKAPAKAASTTKRKTRADDAKTESTDQDAGAVNDVPLDPPRTRGRPKKAVQVAGTHHTTSDVLPKSRGRSAKLVVQVAEDITQPTKTSSRIKKAAMTEVPNTINAPTEVDEPKAAVKLTRARSVREKPQAEVRAAAKPSILKKRVTFQDNNQDDKENVVIPSDTAKKLDPKPSGLKAKPLRKAKATKSTVRGKKAINSEEGPINNLSKDELFQPLSPKKVTQVAKNSSVSSEDELCGEKSPVRALNRSPVKPPMSIKRNQPRSVSDLDLAATPVSPTKVVVSAIMASPVRRPPPSPFKDALKQSPKRVALPNAIGAPAFSTQRSPPKSSLLQSPARKPMSPFKPIDRDSALMTGPGLTASHGLSGSITSQSFKFPTATPSKIFSSPLRPGRSVQQSVKVHKLTSVIQETCLATNSERTELTSCDAKDRAESHPSIMPAPGKTLEVPSNLPQSPSASANGPPASESRCEIFLSQEVCTETPQVISPGERHENAVDLFNVALPLFRYTTIDSESEDELQSHLDFTPRLPMQEEVSFMTDITPMPQIPLGTPGNVPGHQHSKHRSHATPSNTAEFSMTPLAMQLSSWMASSPEKKSQIQDQDRTQGIFPAIISRASIRSGDEQQRFRRSSLFKPGLFDDEMLVRDQENATLTQEDVHEQNINMMVNELGEDSQELEIYGDENTVPIDPQLLVEQQVQQPPPETVTPARIFQSNPREIHTVSKVPLRPAAEDSPLRMPRKRSQSVSGPLRNKKEILRPSIGRSNTNISYDIEGDMVMTLQPEQPIEPLALEDVTPCRPSTPSNGTWSTLGTPTRTVRKGADAQILRGAVVFVDVHTTEGADASGIFVELLTQMGAKCIKQWAWNPRASSGTALESNTNDQDPCVNSSTSSGKVGITHVVYKDGGKRTLEKIRESKGLVLCVGVSWVLEYVSTRSGICTQYLTLSLAVSARISGLKNLDMLLILPLSLEVVPVGGSRWNQECY